MTKVKIKIVFVMLFFLQLTNINSIKKDIVGNQDEVMIMMLEGDIIWIKWLSCEK